MQVVLVMVLEADTVLLELCEMEPVMGEVSEM